MWVWVWVRVQAWVHVFVCVISCVCVHRWVCRSVRLKSTGLPRSCKHCCRVTLPRPSVPARTCICGCETNLAWMSKPGLSLQLCALNYAKALCFGGCATGLGSTMRMHGCACRWCTRRASRGSMCRRPPPRRASSSGTAALLGRATCGQPSTWCVQAAYGVDREEKLGGALGIGGDRLRACRKHGKGRAASHRVALWTGVELQGCVAEAHRAAGAVRRSAWHRPNDWKRALRGGPQMQISGNPGPRPRQPRALPQAT